MSDEGSTDYQKMSDSDSNDETYVKRYKKYKKKSNLFNDDAAWYDKEYDQFLTNKQEYERQMGTPFPFAFDKSYRAHIAENKGLKPQYPYVGSDRSRSPPSSRDRPRSPFSSEKNLPFSFEKRSRSPAASDERSKSPFSAEKNLRERRLSPFACGESKNKSSPFAIDKLQKKFAIEESIRKKSPFACGESDQKKSPFACGESDKKKSPFACGESDNRKSTFAIDQKKSPFACGESNQKKSPFACGESNQKKSPFACGESDQKKSPFSCGENKPNSPFACGESDKKKSTFAIDQKNSPFAPNRSPFSVNESHTYQQSKEKYVPRRSPRTGDAFRTSDAFRKSDGEVINPPSYLRNRSSYAHRSPFANEQNYGKSPFGCDCSDTQKNDKMKEIYKRRKQERNLAGDVSSVKSADGKAPSAATFSANEMKIQRR